MKVAYHDYSISEEEGKHIEITVCLWKMVFICNQVPGNSKWMQGKKNIGHLASHISVQIFGILSDFKNYESEFK